MAYGIHVFLFLVAIVHLSRGNVSSCTYMDAASGKTFDFSSLINPNGYYLFRQQVYSIGGYSLDSLVSDDMVNVTFYVQVCQNIKTPPPGCSDPGAIYSVTQDGKCTSWGNAEVAIFDINPYKNGANLKLYHGSAIDNISNNAAIIYFVCNSSARGKQAEAPAFEHVKAAINQAHFKFPTHLAC